MKKLMFSAAILAFAGVTAFSSVSHPVNATKAAFVLQDTTDTTSTPADTTSTDTTSTPADTTKAN
ncbi:hypothetical protein [Arcticibacter tournemirensis]